MTRITFSIVLAVAMLLPAVALAHPGHGHTPASSILHYLAEPVHAVVIVVAAIALALGVRMLRKKARRSPGS